ncbi:MAG: ATP-binding protein [Polyangiaceae bacterium]
MVEMVADRLRAAQRARFVGRTRELEAWAEALASGEPPLLYVHGEGGIGKTTLLAIYAEMAEAAGVPAVRVDARAAEGSAEAFLRLVSAAMDAREGGARDMAAPIEAMRRGPARALLIDTIELAGGLEDWLRTTFLPALPAATRVVLAGRAPPPLAMRLDPGWSDRLVVLPLAALDESMARDLLSRRGVDAAEAARIAGVARGHPLALALAADIARQRRASPPGEALAPGEALERDVLRGLVHAFARDVPDGLHRVALHTACLVRVTDEALLRAVVDDARAPALFDWLRDLSFVVHATDGVFPHDLAREALAVEFEQRDRGATRALTRRVREAQLERLFATDDPEERVRVVLDLLFAGRTRPWAKSFFAWRGQQRAYVDRATLADQEAILRLVEENEGVGSREAAERWLTRAPEAFRVFREDARVIAFYAMLEVEEHDREIDWDPAIIGAFRHADLHGPLGAGERMLVARFWIVGGAYQEVSPIQDLIQARLGSLWFTTERVAWSFVPTQRHDVWRAQFEALGMPAAEDAAFVVGGRRSVPYAHDWRRIPPRAWLALPPPRPTWRDAAASRAHHEWRDSVARRERSTPSEGAGTGPAQSAESLAQGVDPMSDGAALEGLPEGPAQSRGVAPRGGAAQGMGGNGAKRLEKGRGTVKSYSPPAERTETLTRSEFDAAVRRALRDFVRDHALAANALARSYTARSRLTAQSGEEGTAEVVRDLLRDAGDALDDHPKDRKLLRALDATYFKLARSQEAAAERLGIPFGTYRRHLTLGICRLCDLLWMRESAARARADA